MFNIKNTSSVGAEVRFTSSVFITFPFGSCPFKAAQFHLPLPASPVLKGFTNLQDPAWPDREREDQDTSTGGLGRLRRLR